MNGRPPRPTEPLILRTTASLLVGLLAVLSVFELLRGHDAPGGGFVGGLLLAAAVAVWALAHGPADARARLRVDPRALIGAGLAVAGTAAMAGPIAGGTFFAPLAAGYLPAVGEIGTVLAFDVGVYVLVAGTAITILLTLLEEER